MTEISISRMERRLLGRCWVAMYCRTWWCLQRLKVCRLASRLLPALCAKRVLRLQRVSPRKPIFTLLAFDGKCKPTLNFASSLAFPIDYGALLTLITSSSDINMPPRIRTKRLPLEDQTYHSGSVSVQAHFPVRRKTVRRRPGTAARNIRQETLTQLSFTRLRDNNEDEDGVRIVGDSQEEEESDEEFRLPQKKRKSVSTPVMVSTAETLRKRRRISSTASENQRTMTQMLPRLPVSIDLEDAETHTGVELSSQDYKDLSEEEETVKFSRMDDWIATQSQHEGRLAANADLPAQIVQCISEEEDEPALPSSSPARPVFSSNNTPTTPKRFRVLEVPSSQSPAATPISSKLSPSKPRRRGLLTSPLKGKHTKYETVRLPPLKLAKERSPLKERPANIQTMEELPQKPEQIKAIPSKRPTSPRVASMASPKVARCNSQGHNKPDDQEICDPIRSPVDDETLVQDGPQIIQLAVESPTKQRVALFNARYAALTRQGSDQSSRCRTGPFERNQVIRSSTGWSSREDEEVNDVMSTPSQQAETQFPIGDETQAILRAIDLATDAESVCPRPEEQNGKLEPDVGGNGRLSPSLGNRRAKASSHHAFDVESLDSAGTVPPITSPSTKVRMESQIKEERLQSSQYQWEDTIQQRDEEERVPSSQNDGAKEDHSHDTSAQPGEEDEERVPSSQNEDVLQDSNHLGPVLHVNSFHQKRDSSFQTLAKVVEDSQEAGSSLDDLDEDIKPERPHVRFEDRVPEAYAEETQWLPPIDYYESQDSASAQLLRETQARVLSDPIFVASSPVAARISPQPSMSSHHSSDLLASQRIPPLFHNPSTAAFDRGRPSQATTVDYTQPSSTLRTQRHLPSSPIRPTQSLLMPSSPVPVPPEFCSSPSSSKSYCGQTPTTMRYVGMAPLTISQLIPESLRNEGSIAVPPMWTQDYEDDDDL
jgi:hypothetical protein